MATDAPTVSYDEFHRWAEENRRAQAAAKTIRVCFQQNCPWHTHE